MSRNIIARRTRVSRRTCARWSAVVAVPLVALLLEAAGEATHRKATQFLLVPPPP